MTTTDKERLARLEQYRFHLEDMARKLDRVANDAEVLLRFFADMTVMENPELSLYMLQSDLWRWCTFIQRCSIEAKDKMDRTKEVVTEIDARACD